MPLCLNGENVKVIKVVKLIRNGDRMNVDRIDFGLYLFTRFCSGF